MSAGWDTEKLLDWVLGVALSILILVVLTAFVWWVVRQQREADARSECRASGYHVVKGPDDEWTCVKSWTPDMERK